MFKVTDLNDIIKIESLQSMISGFNLMHGILTQEHIDKVELIQEMLDHIEGITVDDKLDSIIEELTIIETRALIGITDG